MKTLLVFFFFAIMVCASTFVFATKIEDADIEAEKREFGILKQEFISRVGHRKQIVNTSKLSLRSLPGCLTMSSCKICGFYCGPGWCSDEYISESSCVSEGIWGIAPISGDESCVDSCCRTHDHCCGAGTDRAVCNTNIVQCINSNDCGGLCADAVHIALKIVSHFCCGSPCPSYSADAEGNYIPMSLAGKSFCPETKEKENGLNFKLAFTDSKASSDNADVSLFRATVSGCETQLDAALHQGSNRVTVGSANHEDADKIVLPESCAAAAGSVLDQLAASSKIWYFPYTEQLHIQNGKTGAYHTLDKCE